jgi:hypothetical protein
MDNRHFDAMTRTLSTTSRRGAFRAVAGLVLGGVVAGLPVTRRAPSVLAGGDVCEVGEPCEDAGCTCMSPNTCEPDPEEGSTLVCTAPPPPSGNGKDNDKNKKNNDGNDENDKDGGNNGGDGIFWPCNIPWFANNPACNGTLGSLLGG